MNAMTARAGRDIAYAVRVLTRERGFSVTVILTMALAIGVTATLLSILDAVLLALGASPSRILKLVLVQGVAATVCLA